MDTESLVQPNRKWMFFETAEELQGHLQVPDRPEVSAGYADIYHGHWTSPQGQHIEVAVKELKTLIPRDRQTDPEALIKRRDIRMRREVYVWSQTKHPNLHPLLGYQSQPRPRLISPWCCQGNLTHYLRKNPGLSRLDKLRLIFQAACGLEHLHAQDPPICHADIKPENVLIGGLFHVALSDFGLSRVLEGFGRPTGFTTSERVSGTLNYMAGELFTAEKPSASLETDVYAFGGLILTVMSGKIPFHDLRESAIIFRATNNRPPRKEDHSDLPPSDPLWNLIRSCWSETPEARPPMREVLKELWGDICKEEFGLWSGRGLSSGSCYDSSSSSVMDIDTPSGIPAGGILPVLASDPALGDGLQQGFKIAEETRCPMSEEVLFAAQKTLETIELDSKTTPVIRGYIEAAADVGSILLDLSQTMDRNERMAKIIGSDALRLVGRLEQLKEECITCQGEGLATLVIDTQRELRCTQANMEEWYSSGLFASAFSYSDQAEQLKIYGERARKALEEIRLLVTLSVTDLVIELKNTAVRKEQRRLLNRLGDGNYGVKGNSIVDITCLPGTRVDILEYIDGWVRGTSSSQRALWVRGMAGRGKSTIASTVAHQWKFRASCAIFHFRRGQDALNNRLVCALARQLGTSFVSEVRNAVLESIRENEDIANEQLSEQFKTLLVSPLAKLKGHPQPILLIIDAIDECTYSKDVEDFIRLIQRYSSSFPASVRFLLTSRPEAALLRALRPSGWDEVDLDSAPEVSSDLARFIHHACTQIRNDHDLPENWPSTGDISHLVNISQGLFQWARTAVTYIGNGSPVDRLRGLLRRQATWSGLDDLYHQILSKAMDNTRQEPEKRQFLFSLLGTLVIAPHPVSLQVIAALYSDNDIFEGMEQEDIVQFIRKDVLVDLHSLLHIPNCGSEPVRFMHTSIRDLLISEKRCQEKPYHVDTIHHHQLLASMCLGLMLRLLKENICNLSDLSQAASGVQGVADREVPNALRYCCRAWSVHLTEGLGWSESKNPVAPSLVESFKSFSQEKVLGWIEVMSIIGATSEASTVAKQIYHWLLRCPSGIFESLSVINLWNDIHRFIATFLEPISFGPLHIYASALPHCPQNTELWRLYSSSAKVRILGGRRTSIWPSNLWTRSADGIPKEIAFSGDGSVVITASDKGTVQFWDAETGRQAGEPLAGRDSQTVRCICLSPNGRVLAFGSWDDTIRLLDIQAGRQLGEALTTHSYGSECACLSLDGRILASGSRDKTVRLWDTTTRRQLGDPLTGHADPVVSLCFSSDSRVLASGSIDKTIRLWDTQTGRQLGHPLTGHSDRVRCVCFSPDGRVLASGSWDNTIRLWDAQTGAQLGEPLTGHSSAISCVCFSPDGKALASGSRDDTIRLWDTLTGRELGEPLEGHGWIVQCVCFSPDGKVLASGSSDKTVRMWDTQTGRELDKPLAGHSDTTWCRNPDSTRLWDDQDMMESDEPLTGHSHTVQSICFSPDGRVLASGSYDKTIRLWDTRTGRQLGEALTGHSHPVWCVRFSPDGRVLASGSSDDTIQLWDTQTRRQLGEPLTGHSGAISCICFSPDSRILASGSRDDTIRLWDAQTGRRLCDPLTGHSWIVQCICFSPDSRVLASGSKDETIRLWDTHTGRQLGGPLTGHSHTVQSVCFSPDGRVLAS